MLVIAAPGVGAKLTPTSVSQATKKNSPLGRHMLSPDLFVRPTSTHFACMSYVATWHEPKITLPPWLASPQVHAAHTAMLFREHLVQDESDSETENETEGDTPSKRHPHHAAAQAAMTALGDTLPGMANVCGMLPGVQPGVQVSMSSPATGPEIPPGSPTGNMAAGRTVPEPGTSAAGSTVLEGPGTRGLKHT